jgi:type IV pilus assembly protein PilB
MLFGRKDKKGKPKGAPEEESKKGPAATPGKASEGLQSLLEAGQKPDAKPARSFHHLLEEAGLVRDKKGAGAAIPEEEAQRAVAGEAPPVTVRRSEEEMLRMLAEQVGMPYVRIDDYEIDRELLDLVPMPVAQMYKVLPLQQENGRLLVAMADPLNVKTLDDLALLLSREVHGAIASEDDIMSAIDEYYGVSEESIDGMLEQLQSQEIDLDIDEDNFDDLERIANEAPIIKLVNLLLLQAIKDRASDLHVEPYQRSFRIRYRVDGTLHETIPPPKHLQLAIISRLKVMANMNIAERRVPQDGRIKLSMSDREIDLRVSSLPTVNGESVVMRILDKTMMLMGLEQIGLSADDEEKFSKLIRKPNGIIVVTGPTGCGKTTTLYAALSKIYSTTFKIITVENPVEYQLDGVVQVNINENVGLSFARCLRSILRQDPDIIMVGEIRDQETAQIAIEAALTGHLVLATLHTNDAPSTITRLVDMDIEPFLVTSTIEGVLAQRLVRTICTGCREPYNPPLEQLEDLGISPDQLSDVTFYHGRGCADCGYTGYRGRIGIFELFVPTETVRQMIIGREPSMTIAAQARRDGMRSLREDGWDKVLKGITTIEEIVSETQ